MKAFYENRTYAEKRPVHTDVRNNIDFLAHWHTDIEMLYVLGGQQRVGINQEEKILHRGDLAIVTSGQIHYYNNVNLDGKIAMLIFHPRLIGFPDNWPKERYVHTPFLIKEGLNTEKQGVLDTIGGLIISTAREMQDADEFSDYFLRSNICEICGLMLRFFSKSHVDSDDQNHMRNQETTILHEILRFIDDHYTSDLSLGDVAKQVNLSPSWLSKLVKRAIGMTFSDYLENRRIQKAVHLLQSQEIPVTDIAYSCGFESIRTFNRTFKKISGNTPSQCRKDHHRKMAL